MTQMTEFNDYSNDIWYYEHQSFQGSQITKSDTKPCAMGSQIGDVLMTTLIFLQGLMLVCMGLCV